MAIRRWAAQAALISALALALAVGVGLAALSAAPFAEPPSVLATSAIAPPPPGPPPLAMRARVASTEIAHAIIAQLHAGTGRAATRADHDKVRTILDTPAWAAESVSALLPRTSHLDAVAALRLRGTSTSLAVTTSGTPRLAAGDRMIAPITFYYCDRATEDSPIGDGGTFCGHMRDGDIVYSGAAACDYAYLGQRFRIVDDPTGRSYTCADTGSAVHGLHRDIWFQTSDEGVVWQLFIGRRAEIIILPDDDSR
jgi:hypothetical protein